MLRLKIKAFKSRAGRLADSPTKVAILLSSFVVSLVSTGVLLFSHSRSEASPKEQGKISVQETVDGEILGSQETQESSPASIPSPALSPTLKPVPTPTPVLDALTPTPTEVSQSTQPPLGVDESEPELLYYSGPVLAPASEKKELLIISDSLPSDWTVEEQGGTSFVSGKVGQALKIEEGGSLELSGGEVFVASGTLSFWLKPDWSKSQIGEMPILEWNYDGSGNVSSLFEFSWAQNVFLFTLYDEGQNQEGIGEAKTFEAISNDWQYIVLTWDLTQEPFEIVLYINGEKIESGPIAFAPTTKNPSYFIIGGTLLNRESAAFVIDELVLTNWAKDEGEI